MNEKNFKCILTFKNGTHKVLVLSMRKMAQLVCLFKQINDCPWHYDTPWAACSGDEIIVNKISRAKFIKGNSRETYLELLA